jgi:CheY-like chemotaxis protein
VVWNLLLNAIKFTPRGGRVSITLQQVNSSAQLRVTDSGEGIEAKFLPHVFDRFRQAEGSMSRRQGGLGLGLAVVRHLVELHGGSVRAESPGKGCGATFTVELPLAPALQTGTKDFKQIVLRDGSERVGLGPLEPDKPKKQTIRLDGLHVLVVEDDADARSLISMMLERCGASAVLASSATEALQAIETAKPDVVVSDIGMPDQDGYALIRKVRGLPAESGGLIPAIALTGYATGKDRTRALEAGYQAHIAKPIEQAELVAAIASVLKSGS